MDIQTIQVLLLGIISFGFIFEKSLSFLNARQPVPPIPKKLEQYISEKKLLESKAYQKEYFYFGLISSALAFVITIFFIVFGVFGKIDFFLKDYFSNPLVLSLSFFALIFISSDILGIPFEYYKTFVIEEKYGFNKTTPKTFFLDKLKGYIISIIIGGTLFALLIWLIHQIGENFWWIFWLIAALFMVFVNLFYTAIILPLFNKLTPLEDGELKDKILAYARKVDFSVDNIFIMDGSKRSSKANAFFSGFGKRKKVVLFDTLIEQHTPDELVAVLAHEVGHYKKKHIIQSMVMGILHIGAFLFILSKFIYSEEISLALGGNGMAIHLNLIGFMMLITPVSMVLSIFLNVLSRKNEFEADHYAKTTFDGKPLAESLKTLSVNSLSNINPHPAYVFVNYSHPPLLERLEKLEEDEL
jgi:STE24 endopeptidase